MMAKKSPPIPLPVGSISPKAALAAIAASTALPPCFITSKAICVASGCEVAAIAFGAMTSERVAKTRPVIRSAAADGHANVSAKQNRKTRMAIPRCGAPDARLHRQCYLLEPVQSLSRAQPDGAWWRAESAVHVRVHEHFEHRTRARRYGQAGGFACQAACTSAS